MRRISESVLPHGLHAELVRAAALDPATALHVWRRCRDQVDRNDPASARYFPAIWANLPFSAGDDPVLASLRDVHRDTWLRNERLLRRASSVVEQLEAAGIPVLVLKGGALLILHHRDIGARAMGDVDLLVPPSRARDAVHALVRVGWREVFPASSPRGPLKFAFCLLDPDELSIDLHAYALTQSVDDTDFWSASVPLPLNGVEARALCPADQLLHVCLHGLRWTPSPPTSWALDAWRVIESSGSALAWDRLVERARARRLTVSLSRALNHLSQLGAPVPEDVLDALRTLRPLLLERASGAALAGPPNTVRLAVATFDRYIRFRRLAPPEDRPRGLVDFLARGWGVEGLGGVARMTLAKVVQRNHRTIAR